MFESHFTCTILTKVSNNTKPQFAYMKNGIKTIDLKAFDKNEIFRVLSLRTVNHISKTPSGWGNPGI